MKIHSFVLVFYCVLFGVCDSMEIESSRGIFYPRSIINLFTDIFQSNKHVKQLTLFLCEDRSVFDLQPTTNSTRRTNANQSLNFQQIVNLLIDAGEFFVKGDGNIDVTTLKANNDSITTVIDSKEFDSSYAHSLTDFLPRGDFKQGVILDLRCQRSRDVLQQASEHGLFNTSYHWMLLEQPLPMQIEHERIQPSFSSPLILRSSTMPSTPPPPPTTSSSSSAQFFSFGVEFFERLNINMNSEITLVKPQQSNVPPNSTLEWNIYDLYDVWNPGTIYGGALNVSEMGVYIADQRLLKLSFEETTIIRRMNLHGIKIRTMVVVTNSFNESFDQYLDHTYSPHLDSMNRFNYRLLTYVRDIFNFRFLVYRTNSWGYLKNGTFDGMIGALVRKEIDVGGSPIFFRIERAKVIDYTARTWISRPCFVFRHPTGLMRNAFLQPFADYVWYCTVVVGLFIIVTTSYISKREIAIAGKRFHLTFY